MLQRAVSAVGGGGGNSYQIVALKAKSSSVDISNFDSDYITSITGSTTITVTFKKAFEGLLVTGSYCKPNGGSGTYTLVTNTDKGYQSNPVYSISVSANNTITFATDDGWIVLKIFV